MQILEPLHPVEPNAGVLPPSSAVPLLQPISALRPTQITVGLREVAAKRRRHQLDSTAHSQLAHVIPVILGPGQQTYLSDRHHLTLALHCAGIDTVRVAYVDDLSHLDIGAFWSVLEKRSRVYPYDKNGKRRDFETIPASVVQLEDDPFRSLAGELRRRGGFRKSKVAYTEFAWAIFLRRRIAAALVDEDFGAALEIALGLARSDEASQLPGWCGMPPQPAIFGGNARSDDTSLREPV